MKKSELAKVIASLVQKRRKSLGLSQEKLAELAELDRTYISGFERLHRNITLASLEKINNALDFTMEDFINELKNEVKLQNKQRRK